MALVLNLYVELCMFTQVQVQMIYDYGMRAYHQFANNKPQEAVQNAAKFAAAATTVANKEAKMAEKTKHLVLTAGMEATVFNTHLSGEAFRIAFDKQFSQSFKRNLEKQFGVQDIIDYTESVVVSGLDTVAHNSRLTEDNVPDQDKQQVVQSDYSDQRFFKEQALGAQSTISEDSLLVKK